MQLIIRLLSDLCTCSGDTHNSLVDTDVVYDENGIPYIPAKRIKGCIREVAQEMVELGIADAEMHEIFGKEGQQNSASSLSNAYIENYEKVTAALKKCHHAELKSPQNVLNQYTYMRTQTAVNSETGTVQENSLRRIRVVKRGLVFTAECNWNRKVSFPELLGQAVSLVKHMGMSRTRGLGLVEMELIGLDKAQKETLESDRWQHVLLDKNQLYDHNQIKYTVRLRSAMICKSTQGNQAATEDYIAGSKILGLIAGALKPEGYSRLLESGEVIVTNGYITNGEERCVPGQISLQKVKDQRYDSNGEMRIKDMLLTDPLEIRDKQMTPANIRYMDHTGTIEDVETEISYHHQRPSDKSVGRATGLDGSSFYQLAAISPGQNFCGYIYAGREQTKQIIEAVEAMGEVRMGYGRSSEFGAVDFTLDSVEKREEEHKIVRRAILTLGADVLLYNDQGMFTTDVRVLEKELCKMTGCRDLHLEKPYIQFNAIGGYNVTWQRRKPAVYALAKGSTFLLHSENGFDMGLLNGKFAGERVTEGFGELLAKEPAESSDVVVKKVRAEKPAERMVEIMSQDTTGILDGLLQKEFEKRLEQAVRENLKNENLFDQKQMDSMNAAIAKLRVLFGTEHSYENMKNEVREIEKESKNSLCTFLIERIDPEEIGKQVEAEMTEAYGSSFKNKLTEERLFKKVYRAYLAELKYLVKTNQKKGDNKE